MTLSLVDIYLDQDKYIIELAQLNTEIAGDIEDISVQAVNQYATLALKAFQSAVPIRTFQLRNSQIQVDFAKKSQGYPHASVYVVDSLHTASVKPTGPGRSYHPASDLALILDKGQDYFPKKGKSVLQFLKRSRPSEPLAPYSASFSGYTAGWINHGYNLLLSMSI